MYNFSVEKCAKKSWKRGISLGILRLHTGSGPIVANDLYASPLRILVVIFRFKGKNGIFLHFSATLQAV